MPGQVDRASSGVVQWIVPSSKRPKSSGRPASRRTSGLRRPVSPDSGGSDQENEYDDKENRPRNSSSQPAGQEVPVQVSASLCKVICTFVEEHLKELQRHQKLIALARASQENTSHQYPTTNDSGAQVQPVGALKVRDEQTKANATIKQLTNYLKEVTSMNECCDNPANRHLVDEELAQKIAHTKARIIDALDEFIRSNKDYDLPVEECPPSGNHPCLQAHHGSTNGLLEPATIVIINEDGQQEGVYTVPLGGEQVVEVQKCDLEKYRRDMLKLERDTEEMKRLFTEFHGLVRNQSDRIESIEDNIMIATHHISEGQNSLGKTVKGLTVLVPVTGCMAGALIGGPLGLVVGGKLGGLTIGCVTSLLGLFSSVSLRRCIALAKIKSD